MSSIEKPELLIMVDVETSGDIPGDFSMLSLGAVVIGRHTPPYHAGYYMELKPLDGAGVNPLAMAVNRLDLKGLKEYGKFPIDGMWDFHNWIRQVANPDVVRAVMVSDGTYDAMWVSWYFTHFGVTNLFASARGDFNSIDMKSAYFGMKRCRWGQTRSSIVRAKHPEWTTKPHTHNALEDAMEQAERFERMMKS